MEITIHTVDLRIQTHEGFLNSHDLCWNNAVMLSGQRWVRCWVAVSMLWNKWGSTPHLYIYRLNWVRRTWGWWDEWGVTALWTQNSKLSPVGLRPSTLTLGHGGLHNIQYLQLNREETFCFFETWMPERETNPRSLTFLAGTRTPPPFGIVITYIQTDYLWI